MLRFALLTCFACLMLAQPVAFRFPITAAISGNARIAGWNGVAVADFNLDGHLDVVYVGHLLGPFSETLLGLGDGTFRPGPVPPATLLRKPVAGDFDGDGLVDLIYTCDGSYLAGRGDGSFREGSLRGFPGVPGEPFAADLTGDSRVDVICGPDVLINSGGGNFRRTAVLPSDRILVIAVASFLRNGRADILYRDHGDGPDSLFLAPAQGDGTFATPIRIDHPFRLDDGVVTADFDGDGIRDLAGLSLTEPEVNVLAGAGDGRFPRTVRTVFAYPAGSFHLHAAADLNGDRRIDLVAGDFLLSGNGDGAFQFPVPFLGTGERCEELNPAAASCEIRRNLAVVADFNSDGRPDLLNGDAVVIPSFGSIGMKAVLSVVLNATGRTGLMVTGVNAASNQTPVAPNSHVTAFGIDLAPRTESAWTSELPRVLGGVRVHVWDRQNGSTLAPLLFVSPSQINFVNPSTERYATISIERLDQGVTPSALALLAAPSAPGLYNQNDMALGDVLTIASDGTRTSQPITQCAPAGCSLVPIDLSRGEVYVQLYGTGFDNPDPATASCEAGGVSIPITYAGPQRQTQGLNQVNLRIPPQLSGRGVVSMECTFRARPATPSGVPSLPATSNSVQLSFR